MSAIHAHHVLIASASDVIYVIKTGRRAMYDNNLFSYAPQIYIRK